MNRLLNKKIVFVDGFLIRNTLDTDFLSIHTNLGHINWYLSKSYIPDDQIWIDNALRNEADLLLKVLACEIGSPLDAYQVRSLLRKDMTLPGPIPEFVLEQELRDGLLIKYVDGSIVRRHIDPEFAIDAQGFAFDYLPKSEVWIDAKLNRDEWKYIATHLVVEIAHHIRGAIYDVAHDYATTAEKEHRRNDGVGYYPGDMNYPWRDLSSAEVIEKYIVSTQK